MQLLLEFICTFIYGIYLWNLFIQIIYILLAHQAFLQNAQLLHI